MESIFCKGQNCPIKKNCVKYRSYSRLPMNTFHWYGIAPGRCESFEAIRGRDGE